MKDSFGPSLIAWFTKNKRTLLPRLTKDPYHIWIFEIMGQQTQIATLLPYYENWLNQWPTLQDLAKAPLDDILKAWQGLGYYSRARNIHATTTYLMEHNQGQFYNRYQDIKSLPGIGDYSASAIASIAFKEPVIAVDGNVKRVYSRLTKNPSLFKTQKELSLLKDHLRKEAQGLDPGDFNEAMMELGALICKPSLPTCQDCPIQAWCLAYHDKVVDDFPTKPPKKDKPIEEAHTYLCCKDHQILLSNDDQDGLMKGYWRLPMSSKKNPDFINTKKILTTSHHFSHKTWKVTLYQAQDYRGKSSCYQWVSQRDLHHLPLISLHAKLINQVLAK